MEKEQIKNTYNENMGELILKLWDSGMTRKEIQRELGCSIHTINKYCRGYRGEPNENKQLVICLRMDGYYLDEVVSITGLARQTVIQYSDGHKFVSRKTKKLKVMKKKKVKATTTQIEQRDMLGKGVEAGVYSTAVKLREDRDEGRLIRVYYRGLGFEKLNIQVRVRDGVGCDEAGMRWCKKFGRSFLFAEEV